MPIYQYECECGKIKTVVTLKASDEKEQKCYCGKTMKKVVSSGSFKINGYNEKNGYSGGK